MSNNGSDLYSTLASGSHVAHLDVLAGVGVLITPPAQQDVADPLGPVYSVHSVEWDTMTDRLRGEGWELVPDDDDSPFPLGMSKDGGEAFYLLPLNPIHEREAADEDRDLQQMMTTLRIG